MPADFAELYGIQAPDVMALNERAELNGVITGLTTAPGASLSVDVVAGRARSGAVVYEFTSTTNVVLTTADTTNPRKDLIVMTSAGSIIKRDGVAAPADPSASVRRFTFDPSPTDLTNGDVVLA